MDRYQKVEKPRPESAINENEIRITGQGVIRNYVSYATGLLQVRICNLSPLSFAFTTCLVPDAFRFCLLGVAIPILGVL